MRLSVDGRRVAVPSGFGGDVKIPKGARPLYRVQVDAHVEEGLRDLFCGSRGSSWTQSTRRNGKPQRKRPGDALSIPPYAGQFVMRFVTATRCA
jgi:hypothetical protein